ncbi:MAG: endonuclease/exonuclease/phosphatase family protein [Gammaproteobacteria bacterium]
MKLKVFIFLFLSFSISLYANNSLSVMSYNLENFFDTYDDPGKDDKAYLPLSAKQDQSHIDACNKIRVSKWKNECLYLDWSEENKNKKLNNIVATIRSLDKTPDVIAFQEIENINALKDIFYQLKDEGYIDYVLIEGNDYRGIDNAYLSKYKIQKTKQHKIIFSPEFSTKDTRPILEAVIDFNGKPIHFYNVHFPAPYNPIGMRKDAFNTLKNITSSHSNAVIALGDFNVTSFEADKNKTFASLDKDWDISHIAGCSNCFGSHYYRRDDNWSFLDVIIIKENRGITFKNESINVLKTNINTNKEGKPLSFNMNNGEGVSDHLPVIATISMN